MKLANIAVAVVALVSSTVTFAGSVTGSSNVNFVAFDGQKVKKNAPLQVNDTLQHQAVVEVSSIYRNGSDDTFFESSPIVITFTGSTEDIQIIAPPLRTENDVAKFKQTPNLKVQTASGKVLSAKQDYLTGEGFMPNANISDNLNAYNAGDGVAAVKGFAQTSMVAMMPAGSGKATKGKVMVQGENIAEQQLQYWFQQADKETQKRFLDWAKKQ